MKSKRKPRKPLLDLSANIVVLAVDTARRSGWAIRHAHKLKYSGEIDTLDHEALVRACELALNISRAAYLKCKPVLVLERPWGRMNTVLALGMVRERWRAAWVDAGLSQARIVSIYPARWRAGVLGHGAHALPREEVRERERLSAQAEVRPGLVLGEDERTAILISKWATRAPEVARFQSGGHR